MHLKALAIAALFAKGEAADLSDVELSSAFKMGPHIVPLTQEFPTLVKVVNQEHAHAKNDARWASALDPITTSISDMKEQHPQLLSISLKPRFTLLASVL